MQNGWPQPEQIEPDIKRFYARQESFTVVDGCILFADRLVIPSPFRKRCLDQLHQGHPGMQRMKAIARSYVYWPSLDEDIVGYVKACHQCASVAKSPPHAQPVPWPKPSGPWQRVHIDYAGPVDGDYFLVVVDSLTKWPEIVRTHSISTKATIAILRGIFARLVMPITLVSDNGTQFTSSDFASFCAMNGVKHLTTAPYHPQSNGQAERFVDTFKRSVKKIKEGRGTLDEALDIFLLTYRSTPNRSVPEGKSPSEALFGRKIRTSLELLRPPPALSTVEDTRSDGLQRSFNRNDTVYAKVYSRNTWSWVAGVVLERVGDVMYNVWTDTRQMVRSHINQLRSRNSASRLGGDTIRQNTASPLPLDILLSAWDLAHSPRVSQEYGSVPLVPEPTDASNEIASEVTPVPVVEQPASSTPKCDSSSSTNGMEVPRISESSSGSTSTTSTGFESATESEPKVVLPRRSSRPRKQPRWFDPYQLY
ncbi:hypothetical protein RP20_CCG021245 [Aedes albopictus]|nr:hypothetical protein RP20_CCG021245 [Aedes albopictus]